MCVLTGKGGVSKTPVAAWVAVARAKRGHPAKDAFVVLNTALAGHTFLLMHSGEAIHREVNRSQGDMQESVRRLPPRLRDLGFARLLIVILAEATPVHEAERLRTELRQSQIETYGWVINQNLLASESHDPAMAHWGGCKAPHIERA